MGSSHAADPAWIDRATADVRRVQLRPPLPQDGRGPETPGTGGQVVFQPITSNYVWIPGIGTEVHTYGTSASGHTILVRAQGFLPYFYIREHPDHRPLSGERATPGFLPRVLGALDNYLLGKEVGAAYMGAPRTDGGTVVVEYDGTEGGEPPFGPEEDPEEEMNCRDHLEALAQVHSRIPMTPKTRRSWSGRRTPGQNAYDLYGGHLVLETRDEEAFWTTGYDPDPSGVVRVTVAYPALVTKAQAWLEDTYPEAIQVGEANFDFVHRFIVDCGVAPGTWWALASGHWTDLGTLGPRDPEHPRSLCSSDGIRITDPDVTHYEIVVPYGGLGPHTDPDLGVARPLARHLTLTYDIE